MRIVLIGTYEMGRQPFGLASPAAWLRAEGAEVRCVDVSREALDEGVVRAADSIAFHVPMHTATRLAAALLPAVKQMNPRAHICFYGLYAPVNEGYLRRLGVETILGGEFEGGLARLVREWRQGGKEAGRQGKQQHQRQAPPVAQKAREEWGTRKTNTEGNLKFEISDLRGQQKRSGDDGGEERDAKGPSKQRLCNERIEGDSKQSEPVISVKRLEFLVPDRNGMVALENYAQVMMPDGGTRVAGYTEASRGCKHLCRHCPIVPVYNGVFRVVERDVVLADVRQQMAMGAQHITFGDPDFFNGVGHAVRIVEELHREFPHLTYDVTIKVEHLLKHREALAKLRETGCLFVTSAVESVDDKVLERLAKNHTRADFFEAVRLCREAELTLQPTFVAFTPWTTMESYGEMLDALRELGLVDHVAPIQLAIRLLIPAGSRLLELGDVSALVGEFHEEALVYPWKHADARVDALCEEVQGVVHRGEMMGLARARIFERVEEAADGAAGRRRSSNVMVRSTEPVMASRATIPYLNEPWYC